MEFDKDLLKQLANLVTEELIEKIKNGEAQSSDLSVAVKLLKDNGVVASAKDTAQLVEALEEEDMYDDELPEPADIQVYRKAQN